MPTSIPSSSFLRRLCGLSVLTALVVTLGSTTALPERAEATPSVAGVVPAVAEPVPTAPVISSVSPSSGAAGTRVTLVGTGFGGTTGENQVTLNGVTAPVADASSTSVTVTVPAGAGSAPLRLTGPGGTTTSADFVVPPSGYTVTDIDSVGRVSAGGAEATATVAAGGKVGLLLFDGTSGQRVSLLLNAGTIGTSSCCAMKVSIRKPDGGTLLAPTYLGKTGGYIDLTVLPTTGTYTVVVDPEGTATGSVRATLYDVPADPTTSMAVGGAPVTLSTSVPGQRTTATFAGEAGKRVSFRMTSVAYGTSSCCGARVSVLRPDGATLLAPTYVGTSGGWFDPLTLPVTGTYTLLVDPDGAAVGSGVVTTYDVPADPIGDVTVDGGPVEVRTSTPGQNASLRFSGDAGARIALQTTAVAFGTSSCCAIRVSVKKPDGAFLYNPTYAGTSGGWTDVLTLPASGTYVIGVDVDGSGTGSATMRLLSVPADQVVQGTADGTKVTVATTVPGQNTSVRFTGDAGTYVSLVASQVAFGGSSCCAARLSVVSPTGATVLSPTYIGSSNGFIDRLLLPVTGEYVVRIDPEGTSTGSAGLTIHTIPADPAPSVVPGGDPVVVTTTVPGQNARPGFAGKASQRVNLSLSKSSFGTSSCCGAKVSILGPGGQTVLAPTYVGTSGLSRDVVLPADGAYTALIDPEGAATGSVTVKVTSGPSAPVVSSSTHPDPSKAYESGDFSATWTPVGDPAGLRGYSVVIDDQPGTVPAETVSQTTTSVSRTVAQGKWYLHVRAIDAAGFGGATTHFAFRYDVSGPALPVVTSSSHPDPAVSYRATTLAAAWEEPADASGVAGYAVVVDREAATVPAPQVTQTERTLSATVAEGISYVHVRAVDTGGNWGATATFAVRVDTTGPAAPEVVSSTHADPEQTYTSPALVLSWPAASDPAGIAGYAVVLDKKADTTPGEKATQTETSFSTTVGGGVWYAHVRAVDGAGNAGPVTHFRVNVDDASGSGPTPVTGNIVEDTVWGPQGSPYVIEDGLRIVETASLTLLPGTVVKFKRADRYGSITVMGQLLALGTPTQKVTFTSYKDDTAAGDTNGDGAATSPARGDWYHMIFYGGDAFGATTARPVSVVDHADIRYGGYGSGVFLCSAYGSIVAADKSRLIVSNSHIRESQWSNIHSNNGVQPGSFLGVYNNTFSDGNCGVVVRTGDIIGNTFDASFREYAFMSNSPLKVRFQYNTVKGVTLVVGSAPTRAEADVRFNSFLGQTKDWPAADQDLTDYSLNWWGFDLNRETLPACMSSSSMQAHNPPISYTFTEACVKAGGSGVAQPTGYFTKVLPALSAPPGGVPASLREAMAPRVGPVNTHSGALTYTQEDLSVEDAGKVVSAVRTYRSDRAGGSELGKGWFTSFDEKLSKNGDVGTLATGTGDLPFTQDPAAGGVPAAGVSAGYATGSAGSSVTTTDQTTYEFDLEGELTGMVLGDKGHKVDVDRDGGKLTKVTGESGRSISYSREDGRLQTLRDSQDRSVSFAYTDGRVSSAVGVDGKTTKYGYDADGRLSLVTTPAGRVALRAGYDGSGRVVWVEEPGKGRSTVSYDPARSRTSVTRADGSRLDQDYDGFGRVVQERVQGGAGTHTVYDGEGRRIVTVQGVPSVPMVRYSAAASATWFDGRGNPALNIDAVGRTTSSTFNDRHRPLVTTRADGSTITRTYDEDGRLRTVEDPSGRTWEYRHNDRGQITEQKDPLARTTSFDYEDDGDLASVTTTLGGTTRFGYDGLGRPVSVTDPAGGVRTVAFTTWGEPRKIVRPRGGATSITFDDDRRMVGATDPEGGVTRYELDDAGRVETTVDPLGGRTTVVYDAVGRPVEATDARGKSFRREYTVDGFAKSATGPDGSVVRTQHDPLGRELRVTDAVGNVTQQTFDRTGVLRRRETADGAVHAYALDAMGRVTAYTAPDGGVWKTTYAPNDQPSSTTDPLGRRTATTFDAVGRPEQTTDAAGEVTRVTYDDATRAATTTDAMGTLGSVVLDVMGRVVREVDARGGATLTTYDADGNVATIKDASGGTTTFGYDLAGRRVTQTDAEGRRTTASVDASGRITGLTHAGGGEETFGYDANGNLVTRTDAVGGRWSYTFDDANRVLAEVDALDHRTTYAYDDAGRQVAVTDPSGRTHAVRYDAVGRVAAEVDDAGAAWVHTYDLAGNRLSTTDPAGVSVTSVWDKAGQLTRSSGGPTGRVDYAYDALGRLLTTKNAANQVTTNAYDTRSRLTTATDVLGQVTSFDHDADGNLTKRRSPSGRAETWTYTPTDLLRTATDGAGNTSTYGYDKTGLLSSIRLPRGGTYAYEHDGAGRMSAEVTPTGARTRYEYDAAGQLVRRILPSGSVVSSTYDAAGRLDRETAGQTTRDFDYDAAGRMTRASSGTSTVAFGYDDRGLLESATDALGTTTFGYDAAQRLTRQTPPTGTASAFTYDAAGRIATVRGGTNLDYGYDTLGRLLQRRAVSPTTSASTETRTYDALGRLLTLKSGSSAGYSTAATYTADSQISTLTQTASGNTASNASSFEYDDAGRLTKETVTPSGGTAATTTYAWDADANRVSTTLPDGSRVDSLYDAAGALQSASDGTALSYDANGNLTSVTGPNGPRSFSYDGWGQIDSATVGAAQVQYGRDALGRSASRTSAAGTERTGFVGASGLVGRYASATGTVSQLTRDPVGSLLSSATDGAPSARVFGTVHGDLAATVDQSSGAIRSSSVYSAFGQSSTSGSVSVPLGFQSMMTDTLTGLVDMGFRQYDPSNGRFTSQDDVIGGLASPVTLNRYTYANADPLNFFDPDGHFGIDLGAAGDWLADNIGDPLANAFSSGASAVADVVTGAASSLSNAVSTVVGAVSNTASNVWNSAPVRDARAAVSSTYREIQQVANSAASSVSSVVNAAGGGHAVLDLAGMIPVVGEAFDVINGFWYLAEGDYLNAALSLAAVVPVVGSAFTGARVAMRGYDAYRGLDNGRDALNGLQAAQSVRRSDGLTPSRLPNTDGRHAAPSGGGGHQASSAGSCVLPAASAFRSFSGDTEVLMADGSRRPIGEIEVGDDVLALDPETGERGSRQVTHVWVHEDDLSTLDTGAGSVTTTRDHPFWNETEQRWEDAADLDTGDHLLGVDGRQVEVSGLSPASTRGTAYNLTVDGVHTYFVRAGDADVLVHNTGGSGGACPAAGAVPSARELVETTARAQAARGTDELMKALSTSERAAMERAPWLWRPMLGQAVHRSTRDALEEAYPGRFQYFTRGPDFLDTSTGDWLELTTPGQVRAHELRPGYEIAEMCTYTLGAC